MRPARDDSAGLKPGSVVVVLGMRPEIINLAEIVQRLGSAGRIPYTAQHYDDTLAGVFFRKFGLDVGAASQSRRTVAGKQIGKAVTQLTRYLAERPANVVVVQGDTNAALTGA